MVETVDTHCQLPQAQLFDGRQLEDRWRKSLNDPVHDGQRNEFSPGTPPGMRATLVRPLDGVGEWYQFAASHPHTEIFKPT